MKIDKLIKKYEDKSKSLKRRGASHTNPEYVMEYKTTVRLLRIFINELKELKK